ncbi:MAG: protein kinase [Victivallales bacterium]|nr:protein kinase [Victivallales bacterium]
MEQKNPTFEADCRFLEEKLGEVRIYRRDLQRNGKGGYGKIFLGRETGACPRYLAVKLVRPETPSAALQIETGALQEYQEKIKGHTNLVSVFHVLGGKENDGFLLYTMALADNAVSQEPVQAEAEINGYETDSLLGRMGDRPFTLDEINRMVQGLLDGLAELEKLSLVHRDLKPENIFFMNRNIVLGDVGTMVKAGQAVECVGTPSYMAPEKLACSRRNELVEFQCADDLYQLGAVIYLLALEPSVRRRFMREQYEAVKSQGRSLRRSGLRGYSGGLSELEARLLNQFLNTGWRSSGLFGKRKCACADEPAERFAGVEEFRNAWNELVAMAQEPSRRRRKRLVRLGVVGFGVLCVLVSMQLFVAHRRIGQQAQLDAQQEMKRWLLTHPPLATYSPQAEWETPWMRVLFDHDNPNYDPLGGRLDTSWHAFATSPAGKLQKMKRPVAALPETSRSGAKRELLMRWVGQALEPEFEVQFLLLAEPARCGFSVSLTDDSQEQKRLDFSCTVTHAGFFPEGENPREEGKLVEHGVRLIYANQQALLATGEGIVKAVEVPPEWDARRWHLSIHVTAAEPGEVSMRHLLLFRPVVDK